MKMPDLWMLFLIAIGLAVDCFTVSLCIGASPRPLTSRSVFRLSFHFGLFQGGMAFLGWALGASLARYIASLDHWIALLLLLWVGSKMIREGVSKEGPAVEADCEDQTRGTSLIMLSIATSIDAFGVGLSLALIKADILSAGLLIGIVSLLLTIVGLLGGKRISRGFGKRAGIVGGIVLILIGLRIVLTHTSA